MPPKKKIERGATENISLGPQVREGELVFGVARIFASFNDTFVHVTDLSGRETLCRVTGGMKVKADRDESSPYAAMLAAQDVAARCKELGINALHIRIRATGGNGTKTPGPGAQSALRALARSGMKIGRIEDVTPTPSDSTRRKGDYFSPQKMTTPPTPVILLLDLPPSILCGIARTQGLSADPKISPDLLTFTTTPTFHGIKSLPPGLHFLFTSPSPSLTLRDGFWFQIPPSSPPTPPPIPTYKWSPSHESLTPCPLSAAHAPITASGGPQTFYEKHLTPYRQSAGTSSSSAQEAKEDRWEALTEHITPGLLTRFTRSEGWGLSSASSGVQDRDEIPGLSAAEVGGVVGGEEKELGMLGVDLKRTWRDGAVGRERTEGARDRSWVLGDVVGKWGGGGGGGGGSEGEGKDDGRSWERVVLGQMEVCFLMVLTLANFSCLEEWKRILAVVLTCEKAVWERPAFFASFLRVLRRQLERADDVEGGLFDMSDDGGGFLKGLLKRFRRTLEGKTTGGVVQGVDDLKEEFGEVERWVREQYGWELGDEFVRKGILELEDGEMVEMETGEMDEEDESGDYAPVVVEL
ncbi:MAG: hypothetical protein Q9208_008312 [Pyrenodesmia sp. 3 TL-2023]